MLKTRRFPNSLWPFKSFPSAVLDLCIGTDFAQSLVHALVETIEALETEEATIQDVASSGLRCQLVKSC